VPYEILQYVPHDWKILDAHAISNVLIDMVLNDLRTGGIEEVQKFHPKTTIAIDGQLFEARYDITNNEKK